jgi:hypothetical protein
MRFAMVACVTALFSALVWPADMEAAECVSKPTLTLSEKLHGKTIDLSGASVPNVGLHVVDLGGVVKAEFQSDAKGAFIFDFSSLPKGEYELVTTMQGFKSQIARINVAGRNFRLWRRPLQVTLGFGFECDTRVSRVPLLFY